MANKIKGIEIVGLDPLLKAFKGLPKEFSGSIVRNIARKPANRIISTARHLFPSDSGVTKRSLGILKVKDHKQMFIELGIKGRSLAYIFMFWKGRERHKKSGASTGEISSPGNVIFRAADQIGNRVMKELTVDLTKVMARGLKRYIKK